MPKYVFLDYVPTPLKNDGEVMVLTYGCEFEAKSVPASLAGKVKRLPSRMAPPAQPTAPPPEPVVEVLDQLRPLLVLGNETEIEQPVKPRRGRKKSTTPGA